MGLRWVGKDGVVSTLRSASFVVSVTGFVSSGVHLWDDECPAQSIVYVCINRTKLRSLRLSWCIKVRTWVVNVCMGFVHYRIISNVLATN
jgi:hypothetical protein